MKLILRHPKKRSVVLDANILINLLDMNYLYILPELVKYEFWVPRDVNSEVHRKNQRVRLRKASKLTWIKDLKITDMTD